MHALFDVAGDAPDGLVRLPPQRALRVGGVVTAGRDPFAADRLAPVIGQPPDAHQEPEAALETGVAPLDFLLWRRHEHDVQPQRVGAELLDHIVGIDDVPFRLRHDLAVLQDHALGQQPRERFAETRHAEVAEHAGEKPRVDEVQDGVLDAAAVEIDRSPVADLLGIERQAGVLRIAEAEEVPR